MAKATYSPQRAEFHVFQKKKRKKEKLRKRPAENWRAA